MHGTSNNELTRENLNTYQQQQVRARDNEDSQEQKLLDATLNFGIPLTENVMDVLVRQYDEMMPMERFLSEDVRPLSIGWLMRPTMSDHDRNEHHRS